MTETPRVRGSARQVRHFVGPARRALFRIRRARLAASRSVSAENGRRDPMSGLAQDSVLRLAPGCRLSAAEGQGDLLLIPEGALRLKGPARAILDLCNVERACRAVIPELTHRYHSLDAQRIEAPLVAFLAPLPPLAAHHSIPLT